MRATLTLLLLLAACTGGPGNQDPGEPGDPGGGNPPPPPPTLSGGVLATFAVVDETFRVFVTNPATIQQLFDLRDGVATANIPSGRLLTGPGEAGHNLPWSWHLDPEETQMIEVAAEVCDGRPSLVESELANYLLFGFYCPWSATLVTLEDFR